MRFRVNRKYLVVFKINCLSPLRFRVSNETYLPGTDLDKFAGGPAKRAEIVFLKPPETVPNPLQGVQTTPQGLSVSGLHNRKKILHRD